jgi:hypothetical protein
LYSKLSIKGVYFVMQTIKNDLVIVARTDRMYAAIAAGETVPIWMFGSSRKRFFRRMATAVMFFLL